MLEMNEEYDVNPAVSALSAQQEVTKDAELYERSVFSEECKEKPSSNISIETLQDTIKTMMEQSNTLTSRVKLTSNFTKSYNIGFDFACRLSKRFRFNKWLRSIE